MFKPKIYSLYKTKKLLKLFEIVKFENSIIISRLILFKTTKK